MVEPNNSPLFQKIGLLSFFLFLWLEKLIIIIWGGIWKLLHFIFCNQAKWRFFLWHFVSKGGNHAFQKFWIDQLQNYITFFDFDSNNKSLKIPTKPINCFHAEKFWNPQPPHRPYCPKKYVFPSWWPTAPLCFRQ